MHIAGFQKNSLIDFPGQIAAVVFTPGCNFVCPYCHNPDLATGPVTAGTHDPEEILSFLEKRKGMLQGLVITGGEPCLQKNLQGFIEKVRAMGFKIKLDSNGTRPEVLAGLFDNGLVDYLAMDIKTDPAHYPLVMKNKKTAGRITESIGLIMDRAKAYEFRTTCLRPFITEEIMEGIGRMIQGAPLYVLQHCSTHVDVLDPDFLKEEDRFFTDPDMERLKAIISPFVREVRIR